MQQMPSTMQAGGGGGRRRRPASMKARPWIARHLRMSILPLRPSSRLSPPAAPHARRARRRASRPALPKACRPNSASRSFGKPNRNASAAITAMVRSANCRFAPGSGRRRPLAACRRWPGQGHWLRQRSARRLGRARPGKGCSFLRNDRLRPLDCPLREIAAVFDRDSFHGGDFVYRFLDTLP